MRELVRFLSLRALIGGGLLVASLGCEPELGSEAIALDYVRVAAKTDALGTQRQGLDGEADPLYLFLNFCEDGCQFTPGPDDARQGTSSIPAREVNLPASVMSYEEHDELLRCLYEIFEPFEISIVRERPQAHRYVEAVVSGKPTDLGLSPTIAGISPLACGLINYGVNFNFFQTIDRTEGIEGLCNVIAHETGHTIGLEHAYLCSDVMTYLPHCESPAVFTRADVDCGGFFREACICGADYQNSYQTVLAELGPRRSPIVLPPRLRFLTPELLVTTLEQGYFVVLDATDENGALEVELFLDDQSQGTLAEPPFVFPTPRDWPLGPVELRAIATNTLGLSSTVTRSLEIIKRAPPFDAGFLDAAGPRPDAGVPWIYPDAGPAPDTGAEIGLGEEGCSCGAMERGPKSTDLGALSLLLLLGLRRRRLRRFALVLSSALLLPGCESEVFTGLRPQLEAEPPIGQAIDFGELILGDPFPRPLDVRLLNRGSGPLLLGEVSLAPSASGELALIGPFRSRIEPDTSTELILSFRPERPGPIGSSLEIPSNDPEQPVATFPVTGRVRERCRLIPWPTALDFKLGDERTLSVLNPTDSPCQVTALALDEDLYELVDAPVLPLDLGPHEEVSITIRHHTRTEDPHVPVRALRIRERESEGAEVRLIGAYPIWNCLDVQPTDYEFPETAAGSVSEVFVSVTNRCEDTAEIASLGLPYGSEAFAWNDLEFPLAVPGLGHTAFRMAFKPPDGLDYAGRLRIDSNDAARLAVYVGLLGRAIGPFFLAPNALDLGAVPAPSPTFPNCSTPVRRLPIFNLGAGALVVHELELQGPDATAFSILGVERDGLALTDWEDGFEVSAHGRAEILLGFSPGRDDPSGHQATLLVTHTPERSQHTVELTARAFGGSNAVEIFAVEPPDLDTLFVVDGSRSMRARHQRLAAEIEPFIARADLETSSNQLGLISTRAERPDGGRLLGCRFRDPVLRSDEGSVVDRAIDFNCALGLNDDDERKTAGLAGTGLALERAAFPSPWDPTSLDNQRFLRREAHLAVIFMSDEDDLSGPDPTFFSVLYRAMKGGRADLVRLHSIVVPPGQRCVGERYSVPGDRYAAVCALAGGSIEDICAADLDPALNRIADRVFAPSRGFPLAHWANPSSLMVFVNGAPALLDPELGYDLDRETNTIVFAEAAAPPVGASIEVHYQSICAPN